MQSPDYQYLDILSEILDAGIIQGNRTDTKAKFIPSATIRWDLREGFPALTTKKLYFNQSIGEILGFIRGYESAADFEVLGCRFWGSDANENKTWLTSPFRKGVDDLGKIYGSTWRNREEFVSVTNTEARAYYQNIGYKFIGYNEDKTILSKQADQLRDCIDKIINNPQDRRNIMHAWFPELFPQMALPPCHVLYEFVADESNKVLHLTMMQRSCDTLLGVPMNLFGSSLILAVVAKATGYEAGQFTHHMTNVHLYENQFKAARIQIQRKALSLPNLNIKTQPTTYDTDTAITWLESLTPYDIEIQNYESCEPLPKVVMAQER